ncbi:MAG: CapA family protein [Mycobacteriales bacterium]
MITTPYRDRPVFAPAYAAVATLVAVVAVGILVPRQHADSGGEPAPAAQGSATPPLLATGTSTGPFRPSSVPRPTATGHPAQQAHPPPAPTSTSPPPNGPPTLIGPAAPPGRPTAASVTLAFTGDMLPHVQIDAQAHADAHGSGYDFRPMLADVAPVIRGADWAVCHQETPVSDNDIGVSAYPSFNGPYELAAAEKWSGYDSCDTASNHSYDIGAGGIRATLGTLDRYGIRHVGTARDPAEASTAVIYDVRGVKVGHLAYTYGLNGDPTVQPWMVNMLDPARVRSDAHRLKQLGADIVIVSVHAGIEQDQTPSAYQIQVDDEIMQSPDVDLIVGAHAHVVQPVRRLADGRWIIYGLGNLLAQQQLDGTTQTPPNRDGVIMLPTFRRDGGHYRITSMGYVPTFVDLPGDHVVYAPGFSHDRTAATLGSMGAPLVDRTPH